MFKPHFRNQKMEHPEHLIHVPLVIMDLNRYETVTWSSPLGLDVRTRVTVLCTGMTGEDGFELLGPPSVLMKLSCRLIHDDPWSITTNIIVAGGSKNICDMLTP